MHKFLFQWNTTNLEIIEAWTLHEAELAFLEKHYSIKLYRVYELYEVLG